MTFAIEAQGLRKSFGTHKAVSGVDLQIWQGELFALLGPNGAGKTTTIHMLTTLLLPDGGTARICGRDVVTEAAEVRKRISVIGQYAALDESLSGMQNLTLFAGLQGYSRKEAKKIAAELLVAFGLEDASGRTVGTYSGGMRRRLDLAAGILSQPEVLFLDEPTTGLDPQSRLELWGAVRGLVKDGTTVLLTTQYLEEADQLADRVGFIAQGRVVAVDTPKQLKATVGSKSLTIQLADGFQSDDICRMLASDYGLEGHSIEDGRTLKLSVTDLSQAHDVIGALMDRAGIEHYSLSEPTLDDVYFALTDGTKRRHRCE